MSVVFWIVVAIGIATVGLLAVLMLSMMKHVKGLNESLRAFQNSVQPILEEIQSDSALAQERMAALSAEAQTVSQARPGRKAGARLRS